MAATTHSPAEVDATADPAPTTDNAPSGDDGAGNDQQTVDASTPSATSRTRRLLSTLAIGVLIVAAAAGSLLLAYELHEGNRLDDRDSLRSNYIKVASDGVIALTTISANSVDADVKNLLAQSSGDFKAEFSGRSTSYTQVVKDAGVSSKGDIVSVGVERFDNNSATLLVAAHADITNDAAAQPESRNYRFRVTVTNGQPPTLSKVDFVL